MLIVPIVLSQLSGDKQRALGTPAIAPKITLRKAVFFYKRLMHFYSPSRLTRCDISSVDHSDRIDKHVLLQGVVVFDKPVFTGSGHCYLIPQTEVSNHIAQADAATVRTNRNIKAGGHQNHGNHIVNAAESRCIDLAMGQRATG